MRKMIVTLLVSAMLGGPLASMASANHIFCDIQRKLGYENVRECEDPHE